MLRCLLLGALVLPLALPAADDCDDEKAPRKGAAAPAGPTLPGSTTAEYHQALLPQVKTLFGADPASVLGRFLAAATADKVRKDAATGVATIPAQAKERLPGYIALYKPVEAAVAKSAAPAAIKDLWLKEHAFACIFPVRQDPPDVDGVGVAERLAAVPGGEMVTIPAGGSLQAEVAKRHPAWSSLPPLRRFLVLRALDAVNPHLSLDHSYRADAASAPADASALALGVNPLWPAMLDRVAACDPDLPFIPPPPAAGTARAEVSVLPLGGGQVRVFAWRLETDARICIPTTAWIDRVANPQRLDLRNLWLADLGGLAGLTPEAIDLAGCRVVDLKPLSALKTLKKLRLAGCPVGDLGPLQGLAIEDLDLSNCPVADLAPIANLPLRRLVLAGTRVLDLTPLKGLPIAILDLDRTAVANLAPLRSLPLTDLRLNPSGPITDFAPVTGIDGLATINDVPKETWIAEFNTRKSGKPAVPAPGGKAAPAKPAAAAPAKPKANLPVLPTGDDL